MLRSRRGQGSLEFLMTYGWVLLIILVVMTVMWQWGLFSLSQKTDPGSFGFWGVNIPQGNEFILHGDGTLEVALTNTVGANVTVQYVNATIEKQFVACVTCGGSPCLYLPGTATANCVIPPGQTRTLRLQNNNWINTPGKRFEATVTIIYNDTRTDGNIYQSSGRLWSSIEP
jgi:hypothetical protein